MDIDFKDSKRMERAIYWHVRLLSGDFSSTEMEDFLHWQQVDLQNEACLQYVEENWSVLEANEDEIQEALEEQTSGAGATKNLSPWVRAVAATIVIAVAALYSLNPFAENHTTAIGEQKTIYLADGSSVSLNTDSELRVDMQAEERAVSLIKGEAYFQVTPDKDRPFTVQVGQRTIRVVGTEFNIFRNSNNTILSVTEGVVAILGSGENDVVDRQLLAGQQVTIDEHNILQKTTGLDLAGVTAWKEGQLVYEDIPLKDFILDLNRYYVGKIILQDRELENMRISGVFQIGDRDKAIKAVENLLPLKAMPLTSNNIILYSKK